MAPNGTSAVTERSRLSAPSAQSAPGRIDWVDYAKGICIVMVVMMHSVLGVELAAGQTGFMHLLVAFAKPFRMPDFFLISGLFLSIVIDRDWRTFLDRKVVHFGYFYVLWVTIQFGFKAPSFAAETSWSHVGFLYLESFIEPFGTLWFIYLLPIFFVVAKATRRVPPALIWLAAAALPAAQIDTGWTAIDEFAGRFVYFFTGYVLAPQVFALAATVEARPLWAMAGLALWAVVNGGLVFFGLAAEPLVSLALGLVGACAVVSLSSLMVRSGAFDVVRYCGQNSIVIYLAFFLPMAATRTLLLRAGVIHDIGTISLVVTVVAVVGALTIWRIALKAGANFLFERPPAFWIAPQKPRAALQAAE